MGKTKRELEQDLEDMRSKLGEAYDLIADALGLEDADEMDADESGDEDQN